LSPIRLAYRQRRLDTLAPLVQRQRRNRLNLYGSLKFLHSKTAGVARPVFVAAISAEMNPTSIAFATAPERRGRLGVYLIPAKCCSNVDSLAAIENLGVTVSNEARGPTTTDRAVPLARRVTSKRSPAVGDNSIRYLETREASQSGFSSFEVGETKKLPRDRLM
jgi:hypothetical protein